MDNILVVKLILTIVFGAIIGLETETRDVAQKGKVKADSLEREKIGGLRTYTVISLLGGLAGILYLTESFIFAYLLFGSIILFVLAAYILNVQLKKAFGLTTEIAILITFIIGFFTTSNLLSLPIIFVVIVLLTFFLSQKRGFGLLISKIEHKDLIDLIKFGLISLVILPLLPNSDFTLNQIIRALGFAADQNSSFLNNPLFNPFQLWFTVVLVSGISILTYTISKFVGSRSGLLLSGIFGGFISSTSTIASLAIRSKKESNFKLQEILAGVGVISNSLSVITLALLLFVNSSELAVAILPFLTAFCIFGLVIGFLMYFRSKPSTQESIEITYQPFSINPALKFVALILIIRVVIQFLTSLNIDNWLLVIISSISGISGIDAPSVAIAGLYSNNQLSLSLALFTIFLTIGTNIIGKSIYSYIFGQRRFAIYLFLGMILTFLLSSVFIVIAIQAL